MKSCLISHILNDTTTCEEQSFAETSKICHNRNTEASMTSVESSSSTNDVKSILHLVEQHMTDRLEQFARRLDEFQRDQIATKYQLIRIESLLQICTDFIKMYQDQMQNNTVSGKLLDLSPGQPSPKCEENMAKMLTRKMEGNQHESDEVKYNVELGQFRGTHVGGEPAYKTPTNILWNQWIHRLSDHFPLKSGWMDSLTNGKPLFPLSLFGQTSGTAGNDYREPNSAGNTSWTTKESSINYINNPIYRSSRIQRMRGRRSRGNNTRPIWSSGLCEESRLTKQRYSPYCRPNTHSPNGHPNNVFPNFNPFGFVNPVSNGGNVVQENTIPAEDGTNYPNGESDSTDSKKHTLDQYRGAPSKSTSLVGNPIVILNPQEPREIFIGGVHTVPLPLWAYKKCLTMVRGEPHELGPRLCLRLLQSLFSLNYLVTHNYNGSGGKAPIDPTVMGAVLRQAQIQFGSGYFFTEPMALGKLRDYLNNAFRVMAFRQRKGERVRSPFWNEKGEPVHGLDAPAEFAENSDVIVLSRVAEMRPDLQALTDQLKTTENKKKESIKNEIV